MLDEEGDLTNDFVEFHTEKEEKNEHQQQQYASPTKQPVLSHATSEYYAQLAKRLEDQDRKAAADEEKVRAAARADIEKFKRERQDKLDKARRDNLALQERSQKEKEPEGEGNVWEHIVQLIDLKAGKTEGKDITRMRNILLEAKSLPAPKSK